MTEPGRHPAMMDEADLLKDCEVKRQRRSGPGGQHRNKVATAIRLLHRPSGVGSEASERRSQAANLSAAVRRLRVSLAIDVRCSGDCAPSSLWTERCRRGVLRINPDHNDFPSLLAESLDVLSATAWNVSVAAERLGCRPSQLVKLLRLENRALALLNEHRAAAGLRPMR